MWNAFVSVNNNDKYHLSLAGLGYYIYKLIQVGLGQLLSLDGLGQTKKFDPWPLRSSCIFFSIK